MANHRGNKAELGINLRKVEFFLKEVTCESNERISHNIQAGERPVFKATSLVSLLSSFIILQDLPPLHQLTSSTSTDHSLARLYQLPAQDRPWHRRAAFRLRALRQKVPYLGRRPSAASFFESLMMSLVS